MSQAKRIALAVTLFVFTVFSLMAWGQGGRPGGSGGSSSGGTGSNTTRTTIPTQPRQPTQPQQQIQQPVFISGHVVTEDGNPPPERAVIERVCNGAVRREGHTDSHGYFSLQLGQSFASLQDASIGPDDSLSPLPTRNPDPNSFDASSAKLINCEIRAALPGFRSESILLAGRRPLDQPDIGTIVLHPYGKVEGTTVSATSLQAPNEAKKALKKGLDYAKKSKWAEAKEELSKAVQIHPKYAEAWFDLGVVYQRQNQGAEARQAFQQALTADPRFIRPYFALAQMAAAENKWQEAADLTDKALALNPYEYPAAYFLNSVAYYNLHNLERAEKSARSAVRMDSRHSIPEVDLVLSNILIRRQDYASAADLLRSYLKFAPEAPQAESAKDELAKIEKMLSAKPAPATK